MDRSGNTPTHLPPPPRSVHGGLGCGIWFARIFILPHMFVGLMLIGQLGLTLLAAAFGTDIPATVTKAHTSQSSKGGTTYHVQYLYTVDGRAYTNSDSVGATTYAALRQPHTLESDTPRPQVRVRFFGLGPLHYHVLTQDHSAWRSAGELLIFALFWNAILSIFVTILWILPLRTRSLIRHGHATAGTIVKTRVRTGKSTSYYVTFRFTDPESGREIDREMQIARALHSTTALAGHPVTVLYDPRNPQRALAYEFCGYQIDGAGPG